jgi:sugar lactone lactonase YvrE
MADAKAELLVDARCELGEGPVWDGARLVWTDIERAEIWRFDPASMRTDRFVAPDRVGFVAVRATGGLLLGAAKALYLAEIGETGALKTEKVADVEAELAGTRINDGRADRGGNVVFGTMNEAEGHAAIGSFYQYSRAHGLRRLDLPRIGIANSICFSPDGGTIWFCDSPSRVIRCGDYDAGDARVSRVRVFAELSERDGYPDGSIVDADGCLWNAAWGAAVVRRYTPDGRVDRVVDVPAKNPTCPAFGDTDLQTLYVTSSRQEHTDAELARSPQAGGVFASRISGTCGIPDTPFV